MTERGQASDPTASSVCSGDVGEATVAREEAEALCERLRGAVEIKDRRHRLKTFPRCFVGAEAVDALLEEGIASDRECAVQLGNVLLQAGLLHHVLDEHPFRDEGLFYRFLADEDRGEVSRKPDGSRVRWADLLEPVGFGDDRGLQPRVPESDPELGSFEQVDLEAIGVAPLDEHNARLLDSVHPRSWSDPRPKPRYNLVVIGAGAGGLVSAAAAAGVGARVALIESHLLGGDCLNVGCVPSKALLHSARVASLVRRASEHGVQVEGNVSVDFGRVMERLRRLRADISRMDSAERFTQEHGVDVYIGRGRFTGKDTVEVNGATLRFSRAVIATGGSAAIPSIPGLDEAPVLTNANLFNLTDLPPRLGVIGAGPIGVEMAQAFARFGSEVTVFSRRDGILPKEDPHAARIVQASMERDGVSFSLRTRYVRVESNGPGNPVTVVFHEQDGPEQSRTFDGLLVAAGRKPSVEGLGLEVAGVEYDPRQGVSVDDHLRTTNPAIYAVGDVATRYQFTHVADFMARIAVRNALFFGRERMSQLVIPWATYTDPEVAHVGLYEGDLEERGIAYKSFVREFQHVDRAILEGETEGFVKVHVRAGSDEILGATIVGPHAGDMISEISVAMRAGLGLGSLASVIHPYPTIAESIRQTGDAYNRTRLTPALKTLFRHLMEVRR